MIWGVTAVTPPYPAGDFWTSLGGVTAVTPPCPSSSQGGVSIVSGAFLVALLFACFAPTALRPETGLPWAMTWTGWPIDFLVCISVSIKGVRFTVILGMLVAVNVVTTS